MCKSEKYPIYGTFEIYTGENMKYLGTHTGYIDELAFALADEAVESLFFKLIHLHKIKLMPKRTEVEICFDSNSDIWEIEDEEKRKAAWNKLFKNRDVILTKIETYASCKIKMTIEKRKQFGLFF